MSFPNVIYGNEGEQFSVYAQQRWPMGTKMVLPDGRAYRFAEIGGTAVAVARLCQAEAPGANFDELAVPAAEAVGQTDLTVTNGATAITANQFAEGYLNVEDDTGEGHLFKIKSNTADAGSGPVTFTIETTARFEETVLGSGAKAKGLVVAWTTATTVGVTKPVHRDVIIHPSPPTAALAGVTTRAMGANLFGWLAVAGPASVLTSGVLIIGDLCVPGATVDGSVMPSAAIETDGPQVGLVGEVAADTEESLIMLAVPGQI